MFSMKIDATEVLAKLGRLRAGMRDAVASVQPVFGAFMPYSYYAEYGNGRYGPQPSVEPAITRNSQWITSQVINRIMPALQRTVDGGGVAQLREEVEEAWSVVLNGKPRNEARAAARYRTGAHRASIMAYTSEQDVQNAISEGERIQAMQRLKKYSI